MLNEGGGGSVGDGGNGYDGVKDFIECTYTADTYFAIPLYIDYSETWYLEEGFLGIQIGAIALTSWNHFDWNFSKM